jgi:hypothetical protein
MQVKIRVHFFLVLLFAILSLSPFGHCDSGDVASANQPSCKDIASTFYYFVAGAAVLVGAWLSWRRFHLFREREQSVLLSFRIRHMKVQGVFHVFVEIDAENVGKVLLNGKKCEVSLQPIFPNNLGALQKKEKCELRSGGDPEDLYVLDTGEMNTFCFTFRVEINGGPEPIACRVSARFVSEKILSSGRNLTWIKETFYLFETAETAAKAAL